MQEEKFKDYFSRIARRFPLVIVDECQDLSAEQLLIVKRLSLLGVKFHFVGDLNQSIYGFRKSNPAHVRRRMEELGFEEYVLNENWRSGQAIVDVCSNILQSDRVVGNPRIASVMPTVVEYQTARRSASSHSGNEPDTSQGGGRRARACNTPALTYW